MVARKLNRLIAEHPTLIRSKDGHRSHHQSHHRPVLVIMDRNMDLITPVQHASTYQALIDDVLEHKANRSDTDDTNNRRRGRAPPAVRKKFDIDPDVDPFYSQHKFNRSRRRSRATEPSCRTLLLKNNKFAPRREEWNSFRFCWNGRRSWRCTLPYCRRR
mmetsp:Transcript_25800/g.46739  ORF Transcript_25800/g.46739 Transcript_25800/m.46739 type:complete len:160 (+) Transcript_25800:344-823(+)